MVWSSDCNAVVEVVGGPILLGFTASVVALDAAIAPLTLVYVASKVGCHRIGCCNWARGRENWPISLPLIESGSNLVICGLFLIQNFPLPPGSAFVSFLCLHLAIWRALKSLRDERDSPPEKTRIRGGS